MSATRGLYSRRNRAGHERWYVRVGFHGRMQHFGSFATKTEAKQFYQRTKLAQLEQRLDPTRPITIDQTIPELFAAYLPLAQHRRAIREQRRFADWWSAYWPYRTVFSLTAADLEQARVALRTSGRHGRRNERTVSHYMKCLKHAMRMVVQPRSWVIDIWSTLRFEDPGGVPPTPFDPIDEHKLLRQLDREDQDKLRLAIVTGLRRGQVFTLRWEHLLWRQKMIGLPTFKRQKVRFLPLPTDAERLLQHRWRRMGQPETGWIFPHPTNPTLPEDANNWYKVIFRPALLKAGLAAKKYTFHSTRDTFATRFLEAGGNARELQKAGGWSTLQQVEIYTHVVDVHLRQAMNAGARIGSNSRKLQNRSTKR